MGTSAYYIGIYYADTGTTEYRYTIRRRIPSCNRAATRRIPRFYRACVRIIFYKCSPQKYLYKCVPKS